MLDCSRSQSDSPIKSQTAYIVAGEKSGDQLGAQLIKTLLEYNPELNIQGVGGKQMRGEGLRGTIFQEDLAVMGFTQVFLRLPKIYRLFFAIRKEILCLQPRLVVLIDYPDFNLRLARSLRKKGYKGIIIQMVMPTIWAWRKKRKIFLERYYDAVFSIYPFEKHYFSEKNLFFIGNPVADITSCHKVDPLFFEKTSLFPDKPILALFPGSRAQEIYANFSIQLESALCLQKQRPDMQIAVCATESTFCSIQLLLKEKKAAHILVIPHHQRFDLMHHAKVALATSGTVTLELCLFQTPTVVTYKLGFFLRQMGKILQKRIRFFSLPNLLSGELLFPEFVCTAPTAKKIASSLDALLEEPALKEKLSLVSQLLCSENNSKRLRRALDEVLKP